MKTTLLIIVVAICIACSKTHKEYYPNGNIKLKYRIDNGLKDGEYILYYESGSINIKGNYSKNNKHGWWYIYDSSMLLYNQVYYHNGFPYTEMKLNREGQCSYIKLKPRIVYNRDTLYMHRSDSIPFVFYQKNNEIDIKQYLVTVLPDSDTTVDAYTIVCPIENKYIYFDNFNVFKKNVLYYIEVKALQAEDEKLCCCDRVVCDVTSKYVYIE